MSSQLTYAIKFVGDMGNAVAFHRDKLGLKLKFQSPEWSEFETGSVTLALHAASAHNMPGTVQLGFRADDLKAMYAERALNFLSPPKPQHGTLLAKFLDLDGAECSISGPG